MFDAVVARAASQSAVSSSSTFDGGTLLVSAAARHRAPAVRVRIPAREVILATRAPEGLSLHNVLPGTVSAIHVDPAFEHVIVQIAVGRAAAARRSHA